MPCPHFSAEARTPAEPPSSPQSSPHSPTGGSLSPLRFRGDTRAGVQLPRPLEAQALPPTSISSSPPSLLLHTLPFGVLGPLEQTW